MPDLLVRGVDASAKEALVQRAASNGRSLQAEVRRILEAAVCKEDAVLESSVQPNGAVAGGLRSAAFESKVEVDRRIRLRQELREHAIAVRDALALSLPDASSAVDLIAAERMERDAVIAEAVGELTWAGGAR